jgi:hypothetical protein
MSITATFLAPAVAAYYAGGLRPQSGQHTGLVWNGTAYEAWSDANVNNYGLSLVRQGTSLQYVLTLPAGCDQTVPHDVGGIYVEAGSSYNPLAGGDMQAGNGTIGFPSPNITLAPINTTVPSGVVTGSDIIAYMNMSSKPIACSPVDSNGNPIVMVGPVVLRVYMPSSNPATDVTFGTLTGALSNVNATVTWTPAESFNSQVGEYRYSIVDTGNNDLLLGRGKYIIVDAGPAP